MTSRLDDELVLGRAVRLVERARRIVPEYGTGRLPVATHRVSALFVGAGCHVEAMELPEGDGAFAAPAITLGGVRRYPIAVDARAADRQWALLHELAHVLDGALVEPAYLSDADWTHPEERAADTFACAGLVPARMLEAFAGAGGDVEAGVGDVVRYHREDWPAERVEDRARLRVRLWSECGI